MRTKASNQKQTLRFASYLRCSTDDQAHGDFTTIESQRRLDREYINGRIAEIVASGGKAEYVGEFSDEGRTGTNLKRPGWKALLAAAERGEINVVSITYNSRLARGEVFYVAEHLLKEAGATIETVQESFENDASGRLKKKFGILIDGEYCEKVSEHTKTKQQSMVAMGYWTGGYIPFGYTSETVPGTAETQLAGGKVKAAPKHLVPSPTEAQQVRRAMEVFTLGRNMGEVLRYLRDATPDRRWDMDKVRILLTSDVYRGVLRFGANVNLTAHEAIVSEALWDSVEAAFEARAKAQEEPKEVSVVDTHRPEIHAKTERVDTSPYYLRGIIFCPHCGGRMTPSYSRGRSGPIGYYVCIRGGNRSKGDLPCPVQRVNAARVHDAVLAQIARVAEHPTRLDLLLREAVKALPSPTGLREELARENRNRREAEKKIARLTSAIAYGKGVGVASIMKSIGEQEELKAAIEERVKNIEARIESATAKRPDCQALRALWGDFTANWQYLTEKERSNLLPLLVEKITMEEKAKGTLHLSLQSPLVRFGNYPILGAGDGLEPPTFGL